MLLSTCWILLASIIALLWHGHWVIAIGCYCLGALLMFLSDARLPTLERPLANMAPIWPIRLLPATTERWEALHRKDRFAVSSTDAKLLRQQVERRSSIEDDEDGESPYDERYATLAEAMKNAARRAREDNVAYLVRDNAAYVFEPMLRRHMNKTWAVEPSGEVSLLYPMGSKHAIDDDDDA